MYESAGKEPEANSLYQVAAKKFSTSKKVWPSLCSWLGYQTSRSNLRALVADLVQLGRLLDEVWQG